MQLHFEEVTRANEKALLLLKLEKGQAHFIESIEECLQEAKENNVWKPVVIYDGVYMIGFAMYGQFVEFGETRVWLDRFLIDKAYQHKGYGFACVQALLIKLRQEYACDTVYLSVYEENVYAINLYEKAGFIFNGELDSKQEKVMVYKIVPNEKKRCIHT